MYVCSYVWMYVCMSVCIGRLCMGPDPARPSLSILDLFRLAPCRDNCTQSSRDNLGFQDPQYNVYAPHIVQNSNWGSCCKSEVNTHTTSSACTIPQKPGETTCVSKFPRTICICAPHTKKVKLTQLLQVRSTHTQLQVGMGIHAEINWRFCLQFVAALWQCCVYVCVYMYVRYILNHPWLKYMEWKNTCACK